MPPALAELELVVMLSVTRLGDDAYGLRIRKDVSAIERYDYSVGAIYTTLQRLEDKGHLQSVMTEPLPTRGGRSRRVYRVTSAGSKAIRAARQRAEQLWSAAKLGPVL